MSVSGFIDGLLRGGIETYESFETDKNEQSRSITKEFVSVFVFIIVFILIAFFGQKIWNQFLAGAGSGKGFITILKPLPSLWHAIAVYVTISLFFCR